MSNRDRGYRGNPWWVGAIVAVGLLLWFLRPGFDQGRLDTASSPEGIEKASLAHPQNGRLFAAIKESYPDEMRAFVADVGERVRRHTPEAQMTAGNERYMLAAQTRHKPELLRAPPESLAAMGATEIRLVEAMRASTPALCAHYGSTGLQPTDVIPPKIHALVIDLGIARWPATAAGRDHPAKPGPSNIAPQDGAALLAAMRKDGMSAEDIKRFQTGAMASAPAATQCDGIYHLVRGVHALPADQGDRITRWLLAQN